MEENVLYGNLQILVGMVNIFAISVALVWVIMVSWFNSDHVCIRLLFNAFSFNSC